MLFTALAYSCFQLFSSLAGHSILCSILQLLFSLLVFDRCRITIGPTAKHSRACQHLLQNEYFECSWQRQSFAVAHVLEACDRFHSTLPFPKKISVIINNYYYPQLYTNLHLIGPLHSVFMSNNLKGFNQRVREEQGIWAHYSFHSTSIVRTHIYISLHSSQYPVHGHT
jgi:hypothetical protein